MTDESPTPFAYARNAILSGFEEHLVIALRRKFNLSSLDAKTIWLSCPEFQEEFSRKRVQNSKSRGAEPYGSQIWLTRRFNFRMQNCLIFSMIFGVALKALGQGFLLRL